MKIRNGFVSNSSSTSFCIVGVCIGYGKDNYDKSVKLLKNKQLDVIYGLTDDDYSTYIGMSPEKMNDDETLLQFKIRIADQLSGYSMNDLGWITQIPKSPELN